MSKCLSRLFLPVEGSCLCLMAREVDGNPPPAQAEPGEPLQGARLEVLPASFSPLWGKCLIFPADPKDKGFQGLFCNAGEIEALGLPNIAGQAALLLHACPLLRCASTPGCTQACFRRDSCACLLHHCLCCLPHELPACFNTSILLLSAKAAPLPPSMG